MTDLYQRAVKTCPTCVGSGHPPYEENVTAGPHDEVLRCPDRCDGGWIDVPVTEMKGTESWVAVRTPSTGGRKTRPVSWAMIRPGDRVLFPLRGEPDVTGIVLTVDRLMPVIVLPDNSRSPERLGSKLLTLIVDGDPPEHRAAHPDWWPR